MSYLGNDISSVQFHTDTDFLKAISPELCKESNNRTRRLLSGFDDQILHLATEDARSHHTPVCTLPQLAWVTKSPKQYLRQFIPFIQEDIRHKISEELKSILEPTRSLKMPTESTVSSPGPGDDDTFFSKQKLETMKLTTKLCNMPHLDHGFNKELIAFPVPLPSNDNYGSYKEEHAGCSVL